MALLLTLCVVFLPSCFVIEANALSYLKPTPGLDVIESLPYGTSTVVIDVTCDIYTDVDGAIIRFYVDKDSQFWVARTSKSLTNYEYAVNIVSNSPIYSQLCIPSGDSYAITGMKKEPDSDNYPNYEYYYYFAYELKKSKAYTFEATKPWSIPNNDYGDDVTLLKNSVKLYPSISSSQSGEVGSKVDEGFSSVNDKLNGVNDSLHQNGEKLDGINGSVQQNGEKLDEGFSSVNDNLNEGFSNVNDSVQQNGEKLDNLNSTLEETPNKLLEGIKGLFIPTEQDMIEIKDKWQLLLEERFGALYQAGSLITDFSENFTYKGVQSTIELPYVWIPLGDTIFEFGGYDVQIVPDGFDVLRDALITIIDVVCTLAFLVMLRNKFNKIVGDNS